MSSFLVKAVMLFLHDSANQKLTLKILDKRIEMMLVYK